jgi:hypothetical protein
MRHVDLVSVLATLALSVATVPVAAEPRAVVELFTSQGCSSCPPADHLMTELARDSSLVVLSLPVDYWDYLGWKDTLARHDFTLRQQAYSKARGDRDVYTPQVVVNGLSHRVGSDRRAIEAAIRETAVKGGVLRVPVAISRIASGYRVVVGGGLGLGEIWLLPVERAAEVEIGRGENSGATVTYRNVVRGMRRIGSYAGQPVTLDISRGDVSADGADAFAVLVQESVEGHPGAMLGAAMMAADAP